MEDELGLLTSYFNLADGRRQDTADTFRVDSDLPSGTAPGGAALYIVTESSASGQMGPRARRLAADTVAWEYSTHGDEPPTGRLKSALRTAHEEIRREFDGHVAVGISVIALEQDSVYLAQVPPAQVYVLHEGSLHSISAAPPDSSPFGRALGSSARPQITVFRDSIGTGDVLALCTSWFRRTVDADELRDCFGAGTADDIAECLFELAKDHSARDVTAVVIEAVDARDLAEAAQEAPPGFLNQVDLAVQALADVGRMLWSELRVQPAANGRRAASPPLPERAPSQDEPADLAPADEVALEQSTQEVPIVVAARPESGEDTTELEHVQTRARPSRPAAKVAPPSELDQVNSRLQGTPDMADVIPPVQAFPEASTEPERIYATSKDIQAVNRRPRRFGGVGRPEGPPVLRPGPGELDLTRPASRPAPPAAVWIGSAAVLALAAAGLFFFLRGHHTVAADPYPARVHQDLVLARQKPALQSYYLGRARTNINLAATHGAKPATLRKLRRELLVTSDSLHHVTRVLSPTVLTNFASLAGAQPTQIAAGPGQVLVLDAGRKSVFSITPNTSSGPSEIVHSGEVDSNFTVATPRFVALDGSTSLVLDTQNVLVRDAAGTKTATSLTQQLQNEKIVAMSVIDPDVYLLDSANSQLWRYPDGVAAFTPYPQQFFSPTTPNLTQAVSFAFDATNVYILASNGSIQKFDILHANPQKFTVQLPSYLRPLHNPSIITTSPASPWVWIADPSDGRIVQLDKQGKYVRTYRSNASAMNLYAVKGLAIGPAGHTLYVLAGSKLYDFTVSP